MGPNKTTVSDFAETATDVPAAFAAAITPADTDLANVTRQIYVGGVGDLAVTMKGGGIVIFQAVPVGTILRIRASQIRSTDTTASLIVAMW